MRFHIAGYKYDDKVRQHVIATRSTLYFDSQKEADRHILTLYAPNTVFRAEPSDDEVPNVGDTVWTFHLRKKIKEHIVSWVMTFEDGRTSVRVEGVPYTDYKLHTNIFLTKEEAVQHANILKEKEKTKLLKSLAKLEKLTFE